MSLKDSLTQAVLKSPKVSKILNHERVIQTLAHGYELRYFVKKQLRRKELPKERP